MLPILQRGDNANVSVVTIRSSEEQLILCFKERIDDLLNESLLQKMISLLCHENVAIAIPCLRTIGNIVTGDDSQTQMAVDHGLVVALD